MQVKKTTAKTIFSQSYPIWCTTERTEFLPQISSKPFRVAQLVLIY